jgi:hypothetical protein
LLVFPYAKMQFLLLLSFGLRFASAQIFGSDCKVIPGDEDWPKDEVWKSALPGVVQSPLVVANQTRPDYVLTALEPADVQAAVNFSAQHNVRLAIINSGHDFLGRYVEIFDSTWGLFADAFRRNDAPSGLWLVVANLKGIRVLESFTPSEQGAIPVNYTQHPLLSVNIIKPVPGKQAAVTFGVGLSTQELNDALHKSGLVTTGAAASMSFCPN